MKPTYFYCSLMAVCSLLLFAGASSSNQINWVSVNDANVNCSFSFPESYSFNTTNDVRLYAVSADNVTFDVHFASTISTISAPNKDFKANIATIDPNARYDQFVQALAQVTQGQVVSQSNFSLNSYLGRDAEVVFENGIDDQQSRMHVRFIWKNNLMYVFSAFATVGNDAALASARSIFFQSVQLN